VLEGLGNIKKMTAKTLIPFQSDQNTEKAHADGESITTSSKTKNVTYHMGLNLS
jgi:hypothetical protein